MALNERQRRFVDAYLLEPNATKAATTAGYSAKTAHAIGHKLLKVADIASSIEHRSGKAIAKVDASVDRIVRELAALGFSDIRQIMSPDGRNFLPVAQWPREIAVCIASIEVETVDIEAEHHEGDVAPASVSTVSRVTKVKLWPKTQALALLAQYRKMIGAGDTLAGDSRQVFVGLNITVAPGAAVQVNVNGGSNDGK